MSIWYALCDATHLEFLRMTFMKNALLAVCILAPLFGLLSTMIVTGRMSFFSDALGHSGFTGIAVGVLCGARAADRLGGGSGGGVRAAVFVRAQPLAAVGQTRSSACFPRRRSRSAFSSRRSAAAASQNSIRYSDRRYPLGHAGRNRAARAWCCWACALLWVFRGEPAVSDGGASAACLLARHSDGENADAVHGLHCRSSCTLAMSWVGLMVINSLLVLPAASSRNLAQESARVPPVLCSRRARMLRARACHGVLPRLLPPARRLRCIWRSISPSPSSSAADGNKKRPRKRFCFPGAYKTFVAFRPPGRNKMKIHVIRRLRRPEKYRPPRKCGIFVPMGQKIMHTVESVIFSERKVFLSFSETNRQKRLSLFCRIFLAEHCQQEACRDCGADDAGDVGSHGVHQQEVGGVGLLALHLGDARRHRDGGHAGGADQRVDLLLG